MEFRSQYMYTAITYHVKSEGETRAQRHDDVIKWKRFRVTGPLCGQFTDYRWIPITKASDASFDVFFDLHLNKRLS